MDVDAMVLVLRLAVLEEFVVVEMEAWGLFCGIVECGFVGAMVWRLVG